MLSRRLFSKQSHFCSFAEQESGVLVEIQDFCCAWSLHALSVVSPLFGPTKIPNQEKQH